MKTFKKCNMAGKCDPPRVLHLISSSGFFGADNMLVELSKELRHTGYTPIIGVFKNIHNPHVEVAEKAKQYHFPVTLFPCNGRLDLKTIISIRRFLEKQNIGIIHTHGYKSNLYALAASMGKSLPRVATCHNWLGDDPKMKFYARLDKFFLNRFNRVIAVSDSVKQEILNHNISANKVLTIFNGIDTNRFNDPKKVESARREFGIGKGCKVIGTVGRLSEEKGHIHLLNAATKVSQEYPKVVFLIVGDGPLRNHLEEKASAIGQTQHLEKNGPESPFIFTGVRSDMPAIYSLMDIFVLPSLTEGLPMVLLEAMASQKPIVATTVGAIPKVIEHGHSGLLVRPGDAKELAKAITDLLANPQKADKIAKNGHQRVLNHFSSKKMAEKYIDVYQDVLSARRIKN
jgi:glycosyltransferase involved in cell wall biosynthesis